MVVRIYAHRLMVAVLIVAGVIVSPLAHPEDWPQFRGKNRDGRAAETGLLASWPEGGPKPIWTATGIGIGFSSAAIVGDTVYTTGMVEETSEGFLFAFDHDGNQRWSMPYGKEWDGAHPGTRYTPTVYHDRVYLISGHGVVVCADTASGTLRWQRDVAKDFGGEAPVMGFAESLLVDGDLLYCTPGGPDASIVALDANTGETRWTSKGLGDQSAYCSPQLVERGGTRLLITLVAATLVGLDPASGTIVWRVPFDEKEEMQNHSVAPVYSDGLLYVTSGHRKGGKLYALSPDGRAIQEQWADETLNTLTGGLVIHDGHVFGSTSGGRWACLSLEDGTVRYEERGVGKGSITYADGHLYCYGEKGTLALVAASPASHEIIGSFTVEQGKGVHWAHPAIAEGRLYIRHGDTLTAYALR